MSDVGMLLLFIGGPIAIAAAIGLSREPFWLICLRQDMARMEAEREEMIAAAVESRKRVIEAIEALPPILADTTT